MGKAIDLNCDMGESFGIYKIGNDQEMIKHVTSISMGCGFHAGDPHVMRETVTLAKKYEVAVGAHPGYPDLIGFGRRKMEISQQEATDYIAARKAPWGVLPNALEERGPDKRCFRGHTSL